MTLDQDELIEKLMDKWNNCPMCGKKDYEIGKEVLELRECVGGGIDVSDRTLVHPVARVTCKNCGNMMLVDLLKVNVKHYN